MGFNKSFYIRAEKEIKERREANDKALRLRQEEISKKFPKYSLLKDQLAQTGSELIGILSATGSDATKRIEALAQKNIGLQSEIEQLLLNGGYRAGYLDPIYTCQKCRDSGVFEERRCECFKEIVKRLAANELNRKSPIKLSSFASFDLSLYPDSKDSSTGQNIKKVMQHNFNYCKAFAEDFHLPCGGILMCGNTGLGKTHLSLAIANEVIEKGYSVIYGSAPDLLRKIEKEHFSNTNDSDTLELLQGAELLILDDLGAEFESQFYTAALYNLINSRMNSGRAVIINTNFDLQSLQKRYNDRIVSRLMTLELLIFCGQDMRVTRRNSAR